VNNPLTEQDFCYVEAYFPGIKEKVQSAKRLLKVKLKNVDWEDGDDILRLIDTCFQIQDGDDNE
jgi:hypothetical protein